MSQASINAGLRSDTLLSLGESRLGPLCDALGLGHRKAEVQGLFERLSRGWGHLPLQAPSGWKSEVVDDGTPFEISLAYGEQVELRLLAEPWGTQPSLLSNARAAEELMRELVTDYGITLDRYNRIRDLFLPDKPRGPFSIWLAVSFAGNKAPDFKLYLCPLARGVRLAPAVLEEALVRLGFSGAWGVIGQHMGARGPELDQFNYFSLDLGNTPEARVKVYARHQRSTPDDFERVGSGCPSHRPGELRRFLGTVAPGRNMFDGRAPQTCYAFVEGRGDSPASVTTHFPINGYAANDQEVFDAVLASHELLGISPTGYSRTMEVMATRPLDEGVGLQSYVSFRRHKDSPRLTVYMPREAFQPGEVAASGASLKPSGVQEIVQRCEHQGDVLAHPFVRRLARETFNRNRTWLLLANLRVAEEGRARRLAQLAARVDSDVLRSVIAAVLNEDLGGGSFERARVRTFAGWMKEIDSWRPAVVEDWQLSPGRHLDARLNDLGRSLNPYVGTGALMADEVARGLLATFLEEQLPRDERPAPASLPWQRLESRELNPVQALANTVPEESLDALWRGAMEQRRTMWAFFDHLYVACFAGPSAQGALSSGDQRR